MDLMELRPGRYRSTAMDYGPYSSQIFGPPDNPDPRFKRGDLGTYENVKPLSLFSQGFTPQRFTGRSTAGIAAEPQKFVKQRKGGLGDYEKEDMLSMLAPSEKGLPPQKRDRTPMEKVQDMAVGTIGGFGKNVADTVAMPRTLAELLNTSTNRDIIPDKWIDKLPSGEDVQGLYKKYGTGLMSNPVALRNLQQGPQTPGGEYASSLGEWGPVTMGSAIKGIRKLVPWLVSAQSMMP